MNTSLPRALHWCAQLLLVIAVAGSAARASSDNAPEPQVPEPAERCVSCHALTADEPALEGPTLWQIVGRPVASAPDFDYSDALETLGGVWTRERLDRFIAAPQAYAPGTRMELGGVRSAEDRKVVLDFLETLGPDAPTVRAR